TMPLKADLYDFLCKKDFQGIAELAKRRKRVLPTLVSLTFDKEPLITWRAVEAIGIAATSVAAADPEFVRQQLRRLQWLISEESGGVCWRAPEAMAEIVRNNHHLFSDYIPIVITLIETIEPEDLEHFRPGALRAIGRLADVAGDHVHSVLLAITDALSDTDPQARAMAVWCLGQLGVTELLVSRPELGADDAAVELYESGCLIHTTITELYRQTVTA
ncbi:MAG: HEAT repeat domain-containing protein, partial [Gemmatimonadota bacterium]